MGLLFGDRIGVAVSVFFLEVRMMQPHRQLTTVFLSGLLVLASKTHVLATCTEEWQPEPPLLTARHAHGSCTDPCGNIYVLGGRQQPAFEDLDTVEKLAFDGTSYDDSWAFMTPMPTTRRHHAVVSVSGFIYVVGGVGPGEQILGSVVRYDTTTDTWSSGVVPDLILPRSSPSATVDRWGRIYVIGGTDGTNFLTSVEVFDPARPGVGWTSGPELSEARAQAGAAVDKEGRVYAIGGYTAAGHLSSVERFDPCGVDAAWSSVPEVPGVASQTDQAVTGADGRIYVGGGWLPGYTDRVLAFDPDTDMWDICQPLSQARNNLSLVLGGNGRIFAVGGDVCCGPTSTDTVESFLTLPLGQSDAVPTVSEWGLVVMLLLVLGTATLLFRRSFFRTC